MNLMAKYIQIKQLLAGIVLVCLFSSALATPFQAASAGPLGTTPSSPSTLMLDVQNSKVVRVPEDAPSLQSALTQVLDGGVINLAGGAYQAPTGGFQISNQAKSFTIQARTGEIVTLSGSGTRDIFRLMNSSLAQGRPIVFDHLIFANGYSNTGGVAGGVTLYYAQATFIGCTFENNSTGPSGAAGGVLAGFSSKIFFFDSTWNNNSSKDLGGGLRIADHSTVYIHHSNFTNNRTNVPGHNPTSAGGAIHLVDSILRVSNSRFENNQAGYVGGAIYNLGTWTGTPAIPNSDIVIANSQFINNQAVRDASVSLAAATEGGALHFEAQASGVIYNSVFESNRAMAGGAISNYRAKVKIKNSTFKGNQAFAVNSIGGFGGALAAGSNDLPGDGNTNRPVAQVEISDSLFQGRFGSTTIAGRGGGGIYINGDIARMYGLGGVTKLGSLLENRTILIIDRTIFSDLDAQQNPDGGTGGTLFMDMADLTLRDSMIINADAIGTINSSGGALAAIDQTLANLTNVTMANNTAKFYGGAIFVQGSEINLTNCNLIGNSVKNTSSGSAIYSAPDTGRNLAAKGVVKNSLISEHVGVPIYDEDQTNGPINNLRYDNNRFFNPGSTIVYSNSLPNYQSKTVAELNALIVNRQNGISTDKSQISNSALTNKPALGILLPAPPQLNSGESYLGYTWSGLSASLDGSSLLPGSPGVVLTNIPGIHTLTVNGVNYTANISSPAVPAASIVFSPDASSLSWNLEAGTFLESTIDQGFAITSSPSGTANVTTVRRTNYNLYLLTQEGGLVIPVDTRLPVIGLPPTSGFTVFLAGGNQTFSLPICNQGGSALYWTATSLSPILQVNTPSGETVTCDQIVFTVMSDGLSPGLHPASMQVDAGIFGSQNHTVNINVDDGSPKVFLPVVIK